MTGVYYETLWNEGQKLKDLTKTYIFTETKYTFTDKLRGSNRSGEYAYGSEIKIVYFRPEKINGETIAEHYASVTTSDDCYETESDYKASIANGMFFIDYDFYDPVTRTIGGDK